MQKVCFWTVIAREKETTFMKTGCSSIDLSGIWQFAMSERKEDQEFYETVRLPGSMDETG